MIDVSQFIGIVTGGGGAGVLALMFWLIVIKRKLVTIEEHNSSILFQKEGFEARIADLRSAHDTHLALIREQLRLSEEESSRWESIALRSTGTATQAVQAVAP